MNVQTSIIGATARPAKDIWFSQRQRGTAKGTSRISRRRPSPLISRARDILDLPFPLPVADESTDFTVSHLDVAQTVSQPNQPPPAPALRRRIGIAYHRPRIGPKIQFRTLA